MHGSRPGGAEAESFTQRFEDFGIFELVRLASAEGLVIDRRLSARP
jgi:hypothetical protein